MSQFNPYRKPELGNVDLTTNPPTSGNVLTFNGSKWIAQAPVGGSSSSANVYEIELSRWGITNGLPSKPYQTTDYTTANNNINGINNALQYASQNGYNYVVLPKGNYSICYPNTINLSYGNMTVDFNSSTLKVIYDSVNRSPYDNSTNPVYKFGGDSIHVTAPNIHIVNLILIGDRIDRSWPSATLADEVSMEQTNGVKFGAGAHTSSIRYSNLSYYMGDAVALYYSPYNNFDGFTMEFGSFNTSGAKVTGITSESVRTVIPITLSNGINCFSMVGLGYSPLTTIPSGQYNIYFYNSSGTFISYKTNIRVLDLVQIPNNATSFNVSWEGDGTTDGGVGNSGNPPYLATFVENGIADSVQVEYCEIHRCHRGGMFLGTNNAVIRKNYFHDTGAPDGMDIDGLPQFNDGTRYCIDMEDNIAQNCKIIDNIFENSRMGVLLRGEYAEFRGNEMRNCPTSGLQLYQQKHIVIEENYFYYSPIGCFSYSLYDRDWKINNNVFNNSNVSFTGTGTITSISNNYFNNSSSYSSYIETLNFKNNVFDNSYVSAIEKRTLYDGCIFTNNSYLHIDFDVSTVYDKIIRCQFINGGYIFGQSVKQLIVKDSYFRDGYLNYNSNALKFTIDNCEVNNTNYPLLTSPNAADIGLVNYSLEILNHSNINLGLYAPNWKASIDYDNGYQDNFYADIIMPSSYNGFYYQCSTSGISGNTEPNWSTATTNGATISDGNVVWTAYSIVHCPIINGFNWGDLIINDSVVNFNLYNSYSKALLDNYGDFTGTIQIQNSTITSSPSTASNSASQLIALKIDSKSVLTNFSLNNVVVEIQSDMMSAAPTTGIFTLGQLIGNKNPSSANYVGWVCTTAGTANNTTWASGSTYVVGKQVNAGGNVYQCITAGANTSTVQPTGTGLTGTLADGYAWKYINPLAIFKTYGAIS